MWIGAKRSEYKIRLRLDSRRCGKLAHRSIARESIDLASMLAHNSGLAYRWSLGETTIERNNAIQFDVAISETINHHLS